MTLNTTWFDVSRLPSLNKADYNLVDETTIEKKDYADYGNTPIGDDANILLSGTHSGLNIQYDSQFGSVEPDYFNYTNTWLESDFAPKNLQNTYGQGAGLESHSRDKDIVVFSHLTDQDLMGEKGNVINMERGDDWYIGTSYTTQNTQAIMGNLIPTPNMETGTLAVTFPSSREDTGRDTAILGGLNNTWFFNPVSNRVEQEEVNFYNSFIKPFEARDATRPYLSGDSFYDYYKSVFLQGNANDTLVLQGSPQQWEVSGPVDASEVEAFQPGFKAYGDNIARVGGFVKDEGPGPFMKFENVLTGTVVYTSVDTYEEGTIAYDVEFSHGLNTDQSSTDLIAQLKAERDIAPTLEAVLLQSEQQDEHYTLQAESLPANTPYTLVGEGPDKTVTINANLPHEEQLDAMEGALNALLGNIEVPTPPPAEEPAPPVEEPAPPAEEPTPPVEEPAPPAEEPTLTIKEGVVTTQGTQVLNGEVLEEESGYESTLFSFSVDQQTGALSNPQLELLGTEKAGTRFSVEVEPSHGTTFALAPNLARTQQALLQEVLLGLARLLLQQLNNGQYALGIEAANNTFTPIENLLFGAAQYQPGNEPAALRATEENAQSGLFEFEDLWSERSRNPRRYVYDGDFDDERFRLWV
jgi:hypothetical protein